MSKAKDQDILARSLSGDWEARVKLFRKSIWDSTRVRRLGAAYQYLDDFLHDCFTNLMRTGRSFDADRNLGDWVESVAAWTTLERQRMLGSGGPGASGRIRLCAAMEAGDADNRAQVAYMPPRSGPEDSLARRIATLVGEPQLALLSARALKNSTWEEAAAATGQRVNTIGPLLVRALDTLSRFFGAPPPLNDDLEPVFAWVVREDAASNHADALSPKGRIQSMHLDPAFYSPTPEMRMIGLAVPAEVRTITLWDAARASSPPSEALRDHLANCHYCADLLRAMLLMQRAIESGPDVDFLLCPGASTLLDTTGRDYEGFDQHLDECPLCAVERARVLGEEELGAAQGSGAADHRAGAGQGKKLAGAAAVLLLLGGGYLAQRRYSTAKATTLSDPPGATSAATLNATPAPPTVAVNPRYNGLAQAIRLSDMRWLNSVLPQNRRTFGLIADRLEHGDVSGARLVASGITDRDAGTEMLYSMILYQGGNTSEGYQAMLTSESMSPRESFRCWAMMQCAVIVGDIKVVTREAEHLSTDPDYAARAKETLARMRARR